MTTIPPHSLEQMHELLSKEAPARVIPSSTPLVANLKLYETAQVLKVTGLSRRYVDRAVARGRVEPYRFGGTSNRYFSNVQMVKMVTTALSDIKSPGRPRKGQEKK